MNTTEYDQARTYIAEMIGTSRTSFTAGERDILRQLLATPTVKGRFSTLSLDELCNIAEDIVSERAADQPVRRRWRRSG